MFWRFGLDDDRRPGRRHRLIEGGVHAAVGRVDQPRERLEVRGVQLVELTPGQERIDDRVVRAQLLKHARVGGELALRRLLPRLQTQLVVEDLAQLRRRVEVELLPGLLVDRGLQRGHALAHARPHLRQVVDVEPDAAGLHARQHAGERQLDVVEEPPEALLLDLLGHHGRHQGHRRGVRRRGAPRGVREQLAFVLLLDRAEHVGAQVPLAERAQRVLGAGGVEQVAGEHRVERDAVHPATGRDHRAFEGLGVVRPLGCARVGHEPRHRRERGKRGVGGLSAPGGDGQAVHAGPVRIEPDPERSAAREQRLQLLDRRLPQVQLGHVHLRFGTVAHVLEAVEQGSELEGVEEPAHLVGVPSTHHAIGGLDRHGGLRLDPREVLVEAQPIDGGLDVLLLLALQLVDVLDQRLDRAVGLHELGRRLLPHAGHPGDVVAGIPLERHVVEVLRRRDAVLLLHGLLVEHRDVADALSVEHHADAGAHELEEVAVRRDDGGLEALGSRAHGQRAEVVVGLVPVAHAQDRDMQGVEDLLDQAQLGLEVAGRLPAPGLVLGVLGEAYGRGARVEGHGDQVGVLLGEELDQHRGEPVDRVGDLAGLGGQRGWQREEGAVGQAVTVQKEEALWRVRVG